MTQKMSDLNTTMDKMISEIRADRKADMQTRKDMVAELRADRKADMEKMDKTISEISQRFSSDRRADIRMLSGLILSMNASQSFPPRTLSNESVES
jgi:hypothetical protein